MAHAALAGCLAYVVLAALLLRLPATAWRSAAFAWLNIAGVTFLAFAYRDALIAGGALRDNVALLFPSVYLLLVGLVHALLLASGRWPRAGTIAMLLPVLALLAVRALGEDGAALLNARYTAFGWVGLSYLAFRMTLFSAEWHTLEPRPRFTDVVGFAFFPPTFLIGPISPYALHAQGLAARLPRDYLRAGSRALFGAAKIAFFGVLLQRVAFEGLASAGRPAGAGHLLLASFAYFLYLYCNFSGFTDIAIAAAHVVGIPVRENFRSPLTAASVQEFWTRWHITLGDWFRSIVFVPIVGRLARRLPPASRAALVPVTTVGVFLLVGLWHGFAWHFALFGLVHGCAVAMNQAGLPQRLAPLRALHGLLGARVWRIVAVSATFTFVALSFTLFANTVSEFRTLVSGGK